MGKERKVEKGKEQKDNHSDKDNPATETRKSRAALATVYIHTAWQRNTLKGRGFSQGKTSV